LNSEADPVMRPTPLANDRQIALIEGVIPRNLHIGAREGKQRFLLDGRQE